MNYKTTLEFMVTIKADEATLRKMRLQFDGDLSNDAELIHRLSATIKETLLTTGVTNNIEVELQPEHIVNHAEDVGGLSQDLCQEVDLVSHPNGCEHLLELMNTGDEMLCSE